MSSRDSAQGATTKGSTTPRSPRWVVAEHPVLAFFALAYLISWSYWVPLVLAGDRVRAGEGWPTHLPGLAGPAIAAVVVTAVLDGRGGLADLGHRMVRWRAGGRWWWVVVGTVALIGLAYIPPIFTGDAMPTPADLTRYPGVGVVSPIAVVLLVLVGNGLGEETGWRGFAVERLRRDHSLLWTALVVGVGWTLWHLPLFWLEESFRTMGFLALGWAFTILAASVVMTHMYWQGGHSILLLATWHTAYNFASGTEAAGAAAGTAATVLVIIGAWWVLNRARTP